MFSFLDMETQLFRLIKAFRVQIQKPKLLQSQTVVVSEVWTVLTLHSCVREKEKLHEF
jgi:hypothetical protein